MVAAGEEKADFKYLNKLKVYQCSNAKGMWNGGGGGQGLR